MVSFFWNVREYSVCGLGILGVLLFFLIWHLHCENANINIM